MRVKVMGVRGTEGVGTWPSSENLVLFLGDIDPLDDIHDVMGLVIGIFPAGHDAHQIAQLTDFVRIVGHDVVMADQDLVVLPVEVLGFDPDIDGAVHLRGNDITEERLFALLSPGVRAEYVLHLLRIVFIKWQRANGWHVLQVAQLQGGQRASGAGSRAWGRGAEINFQRFKHSQDMIRAYR